MLRILAEAFLLHGIRFGETREHILAWRPNAGVVFLG
jgi:hypothetical protein